MQQFLLSKLNLRQEVTIPDCFINFRGVKMKNCVQNETSRYALGFDEKSNFDRTTQKLFKEFAAKFEERSFEGMEPRSYFNMILDYNKTIEELD